MQDVRLMADAAGTAALTLGLAVYAALIFVSIALVVRESRRHRGGRAIAAGVVAALLTVAGLVAAIVSSVV